MLFEEGVSSVGEEEEEEEEDNLSTRGWTKIPS